MKCKWGKLLAVTLAMTVMISSLTVLRSTVAKAYSAEPDPISIDFEDESLSKWETTRVNAEIVSTTDINGSPTRALEFSKNADSEGKIVLKNTSDMGRIKTLTFKIKLSEDYVTNPGKRFRVYYWYTADTNNRSYFELYYGTENNKTGWYYRGNGNIRSLNFSKFDFTQWVTVNIKYNQYMGSTHTVQNNVESPMVNFYYMDLMFTQGENKWDSAYSMAYGLDGYDGNRGLYHVRYGKYDCDDSYDPADDNATVGFAVPQNSLKGSTALIDDLQLTFFTQEELNDGNIFDPQKYYEKNLKNSRLERTDGDYSTFSVDFEDGLNPFYSLHASVFEECYISTDPDDPDNHVLEFRSRSRMRSGYTQMYTIYDQLWPTGAVQMSSMSFRFKQRSDYGKNGGTWSFVYDYDVNSGDPLNNYRSIQMNSVAYNAVTPYDTTIGTMDVSQGIATSRPLAYPNCLNRYEWIECTINFDYYKNKAIIYLHNTFDDTGLSMTLSITAGARFALYNYHGNGAPLMIDDFKINFVKGEYDVNEEISGIYTYYTGNAYQGPNDTVMLSGEKLYETIDSIEIQTVENNGYDAVNGTPGYIFETSYATDGNEDNLNTKSVSPTWDSQKSQQRDIIQKTMAAVKFVIPEEYDDGIYAVKLNAAKNVGAYEILYLNDPEISFVQGDEGDIVLPNGSLRIIGNDLVPTHNVNDIVVKLKASDGTLYTYVGDALSIYDDDSYSIEITDIGNLAMGKYEVFVHNGYGDGTCWSKPVMITVGANPRDSWPKDVFNVLNYGAANNANKNATPGIIKALDAAYKNGGGVVYFPAGEYHIETTLTIPENVVLKGDGIANTLFIISPCRWQYYKMPDTILSFTGNVEICDISFWATRANAMMGQNSAKGGDTNNNVYIHDVYINYATFEGSITVGGWDGNNTGEMTSKELYGILNTELSTFGKNFMSLKCNGKNIQIYNYTLATRPVGQGFFIAADYAHFDNCYFEGGWSHGTANHSIFENCEVKNSCIGVTGHRLYFAHNYLHDRIDNNRELFIADSTPWEYDSIIQQYREGDNLHYYLLNLSSNLARNALVGSEIIITNGQGKGQSRYVVASNGNLVTFNEPFLVTPNRNSLCQRFIQRTNMYFVGNTFYNGSSIGTYGTAVDWVMENNHFSAVNNATIFGANRGVVLYHTIQNNVMEDATFVHGDGGFGGVATGNSGKSFIQIRGQSSFYPIWAYCFTVRNNEMNGYYVNIVGGSGSDHLVDVIVEGNTFTNVTRAVSASLAVDGTLIRNNVFDAAENLDTLLRVQNDTAGISTILGKKNKIGSYRIIYDNTEDDETRKGDVNGDSKVTLSDATMVRYYVLGRIELDNKQLTRADINEDGVVDLRDAMKIREYILSN